MGDTFKGYRDDQIGIGNEGNTVKINEPGVYFDPESEKELEVFHNAAADALVRMGWVRVNFDENGKRLPTLAGRRPEDTPEIIELRAQLAAAQAQLKTKAAQKAKDKKPKPAAKPKEGEN